MSWTCGLQGNVLHLYSWVNSVAVELKEMEEIFISIVQVLFVSVSKRSSFIFLISWKFLDRAISLGAIPWSQAELQNFAFFMPPIAIVVAAAKSFRSFLLQRMNVPIHGSHFLGSILIPCGYLACASPEKKIAFYDGQMSPNTSAEIRR